MTTRLAEVYALGQSPWCDNVARDQIRAGTYERMMEQDAIVGVTSNPSIFQKAMTAGSAYDEQFRDLAAQGLDAMSIYQLMANQDIRDVLALFRLIYDQTHGRDGYVSLEVSPLLAHETEKTIAEAKQLWTHLNQPNLFVKIPAVAEGLPAIEACITEGINVNVTLIFSLEAYERVILAYLSGLEKLAARGQKNCKEYFPCLVPMPPPCLQTPPPRKRRSSRSRMGMWCKQQSSAVALVQTNW